MNGTKRTFCVEQGLGQHGLSQSDGRMETHSGSRLDFKGEWGVERVEEEGNLFVAHSEGLSQHPIDCFPNPF